jgi:hypothetical protein
MSSQETMQKFSRRQFLRGITVVAAGAYLAGCALPPETERQIPPPDPETIGVNLPRSRAVNQLLAQEDEADLSGFLTLSALLTGVDNLDPVLGQVYLQSLRAGSETGDALNALLEQTLGSGILPTTLEELEALGIFQNEATSAVADKIIEYWYTGIYQNEAGEDVVATWVDALAWKTLTFTKAMTVCGTYRFWTEPPEATID